MSIKWYGLLGSIGVICFCVVAFTRSDPSPKQSDYFTVDTLAKDLIVPWEIVFLPDQTMLFTERAGRVRLYRANRLVDKPALILNDVETTKKMGLLGLCIHPDFAKNNYVYLAYNYKIATSDTPLLKVIRYTFDNDVLRSPTLIVQGIFANQNHTGCRLVFGPDRKLYMTTGDADRPMLAQDLKSLNGKILRVNDDGSAPSDNPFVRNDTARKEIWSYGHRNPQGLVFQPGTGFLFDSEHGPSGGDEVNRIEKGNNYGWPHIHHRDTAAGVVSPIAEYTPSVGPSEAFFYNGNAFPNLQGSLLIACLRGESILKIQLDQGKVVSQGRFLQKQFGRIRALVVGPDGLIYVSTSQNDPPEGKPSPGYDMILRLRPAATGDVAHSFSGSEIANSTEAVVATNGTPENVYQQLCASCHGQNLEGTDRAKGLLSLKNGTTRTDVIRTIRVGILDKGMPSWEGAISPATIKKLADYILSKPKSNQRSGR